MPSNPGEPLLAFVITLSRPVVGYLLIVVSCFSVATLALISKDRRWLELVALFLMLFAAFLLAGIFLFHVVFDRPIVLIESVRT